MTTPILGLTELIASQSQPHVPLNTAVRALEAVAQITAIGIADDPPVSPTDGDTYIVGDTPTGEWVGHEDEVVVLIGGGWTYFTPRSGWIAFVEDEATFYFWDSSVPEWAFMVARGIPKVEVLADITLAAAHNGAKLVVPDGVSPGVIITVPIQASVNLTEDHTTTIVNLGTNAVTIEVETGSPQDLMYYAPTGNTDARSLAQFGICTITKVSPTEWFITGVGLS